MPQGSTCPQGWRAVQGSQRQRDEGLTLIHDRRPRPRSPFAVNRPTLMRGEYKPTGPRGSVAVYDASGLKVPLAIEEVPKSSSVCTHQLCLRHHVPLHCEFQFIPADACLYLEL